MAFDQQECTCDRPRTMIDPPCSCGDKTRVEPRLLISYSGPVGGLAHELHQLAARYPINVTMGDLETAEDWSLLVSISRHPAGKGLRADG